MHGELHPRPYKWTMGSSDILYDVNQEEIQVGRINFNISTKISFENIKDILVERTKSIIMNEQNQLVLYTGTSTKAIANTNTKAMLCNDSIERIFCSGGDDLLDAEDDGKLDSKI